MATSGTYTYSRTLNQTISDALDLIQAVGDGETLSGDHVTRGTTALNGLLKQWQTQGIHLWTYTEGSLFLQVGQSEYDMSATATHTANTYYETTSTAATIATATTLLVTNSDNIVVGDKIGIIQNDNDLFWTTVSGKAGLTLTLTAGITLATVSGAVVYSYKIATATVPELIPISRMLDVRRKEGSDYEIPIVFQSRKDYFNLPNKSQTGTPIQAYYARQDVAGEASGIMYLWNAPSSSVPVINFTYERKIQIMVNANDTLDIPDYATDAVTYGLAKRLIPRFGCSAELTALIMAEAQKYEESMLAYDSALYPITIKMQRYG